MVELAWPFVALVGLGCATWAVWWLGVYQTELANLEERTKTLEKASTTPSADEERLKTIEDRIGRLEFGQSSGA